MRSEFLSKSILTKCKMSDGEDWKIMIFDKDGNKFHKLFEA